MSKTIDRKGWNWAPVPCDVFLSKSLMHADVRVYAYLLWRAGNKERSWPSADTIAKELHMSNGSVRLSFRNLIEDHWIRRVRRVGQSSVTYIFETQKDCREFLPSANLLADGQLTGEPTVGYPVSRLNESKKNKSKKNEEGATAPAPKTPKKKTSEYMDNPAVQLYRDKALMTPNLEAREAIAEKVQDLEKWEGTLATWRLNGWNIRNVVGLLDSYNRTNGGGNSNGAKEKTPQERWEEFRRNNPKAAREVQWQETFRKQGAKVTA